MDSESQVPPFEFAISTGKVLAKNYIVDRDPQADDPVIPVHFMWSDNYRVFYEIIKDQIKDPRLPLVPTEIDQSIFDKELYQIKNEHFWQGSNLKLDTVISILKSATPN